MPSPYCRASSPVSVPPSRMSRSTSARCGANLVTGLETGTVDVGLLRPPVSSSALQVVTLIREPFLAMVPADHRLAQRRTMQLRQFVAEPFVMYSRLALPLIHTRVMEMCKRAVARESRSMPTRSTRSRSFVGAGIGVALAPSTVTSFNMPGLRYRQIADRPAPLPMGVMGAPAAPACCATSSAWPVKPAPCQAGGDPGLKLIQARSAGPHRQPPERRAASPCGDQPDTRHPLKSSASVGPAATTARTDS